MRVPAALAQEWRHEPGWLHALPRLAEECAEAWELELEEPIETPHSFVVPAGRAVLKLNAPSHFEADHEAEALARWDGVGAVRLLERDEARRALLMERCMPGTRLRDAGVNEVAVVVSLLGELRLDLEETRPFRLLTDESERWADELPTRYELAGKPFERTLLEFAVDVYRSADRSATFLVNQDLHSGNVLRAKREPWLVIDPKPLAGEREVDGAGLLRNAATGEDSRRSVGHWLDALRELGLDRDRTRAWGVAHTLAWSWDDTGGWSSHQVELARRILAVV